MKRVILESPYSGAVERNKAYLTLCIYNCIARGESPYASHQMLTTALDDNNTAERKLGIEAGFSWREAAHLTVFYCDFGFSTGMKEALKICVDKKYPFEIRTLWTKLEHVQVPQ